MRLGLKVFHTGRTNCTNERESSMELWNFTQVKMDVYAEPKDDSQLLTKFTYKDVI